MSLLALLLIVWLAGALLVLAADDWPTWGEWALMALWPLTLPLGLFFRWWQWGTKKKRLYRYSDLRWYQRGLQERRG